MVARVCLDCPATLTSKSPRCPEHRAVRRAAVRREISARWYAVPGNARRHQAQERRRLRTRRLHALADQLGYILVPL